MSENIESSDQLQLQREKLKYLTKAYEINSTHAKANLLLGQLLFEAKYWNLAIEHLEVAYENDQSLTNAAVSAIYLRNNVCKWGINGTKYYDDMKTLIRIVKNEIQTLFMKVDSIEQQSAVHPHMSLAFPLNPVMKLAIAKSHAEAEKVLVLASGLKPYNHDNKEARLKYNLAIKSNKLFRIKVGYVSANFKSKTTAYMAQDLMRFHDKKNFEIHVYATTGPDDENTMKLMRGVDWRSKIERGVEFFHDTSQLNVLQVRQFGDM